MTFSSYKFWIVPAMVVASLAHNNDSDIIGNNTDSSFQADSFWDVTLSAAKEGDPSLFISDIHSHFDKKRQSHMRDVNLN